MFEYLQKHIYDKGGTDILYNTFESVTSEEIKEAEKILGFTFPSQLRQFYEEIGYGTLQAPNEYDENTYKFYGTNEILPPMVVANFSKGILLWEGQTQHWMAEPTYELLEPGDLPFFEISDSTNFLIMKAHSDNPNAIWTEGGDIKIEDSFERFIWRLYYESPVFYGDIIENYYKTDPIGIEKALHLERTLEARQYKACPDNLSLAEELIYYMNNQELDKARARLVKILNNSESFTELKGEIHNIPLTILHGLVELMLSKSQYHKAECEELLTLRMEKFQTVNNEARGNSHDPSSR